MQAMATDENTPNDTMFNINRKKKSTKKRLNRDALLEATAITDSTDNMAENEKNNDENDFTYEYLITRAFDIIRKNNPEKPGEHPERIILPPPQLGRIGRRTSFTNFGVMCKILQRQEKLLYDYFVVELGGARASIDANHALIIRGRLGERQIENILRSFINEYVICKTCHFPDTLLSKENRLTVIKCNNCHSKYTVPNIKTGVQA